MREKAKRILMTTAGVCTSGFSVGLFQCSNFGTDPFSCLVYGIRMHTAFGYGTVYTIMNLLMLIAVFLIDKRKIGLGTFINIFILGYIVEFSSWLFKTLAPSPSVPLRILFMCVGIVILCFGSSLYFTGDLGVSTYDAAALVMTEKRLAKFQYCRIGTDMICTATGFLLGSTVGVGTLVTALFMGPLIAWFRYHIAMPFRYGRDKAAVLIGEEKTERTQRASAQT